MSDELVPMKDQNALVMGDGKVYKIQKVRQRKIHSCVPCHQRKVKCSREQPVCENCTKNQLECKYFVNDRVSRGKKNKDIDKQLELQKKKELKQYMERAKTMVASTSPQLEDHPGSVLSGTSLSQLSSHSITTATTATTPMSQSAEDVVQEVQDAHDAADVSSDRNSGSYDSDSSLSIESLSPPNMHNPQVLPTEKHHNHHHHNGSDYHNHHHHHQHNTSHHQSQRPSPTVVDQGQPLSNSILSDFSLRQTPIPAAAPMPMSLNLTNHSLPMILVPKQADIVPNWKLDEIYNALPSKERSYGLVKRYITSIHPVLPLLDMNEFLRDHDAFWDNTLENKLEFLALLFPVVYAASKGECFEFSYDEITKFELSNEIHKYLRIARVIFQTIGYPQKFSLRVLQSSVLLHSTLENPSLIDISILARIAQMIDLHRDPATYHNISDPSLVQLRRLLWWEIFYLDSMTALKNMSTPQIRLDEFDTSLPVEYVNNALNFQTCYLNGKFRFTLILNELTRFIYGLNILPFNTIQVLKQKILDLHISCNASIMNLENAESQDLSYEQRTFIQWSKSVLNTYCDRALLLLQKKIILSNVLNTNEDGNNQIFHNSYNQMVNNQRSMFSIDALFKSQRYSGQTTSYSYDDLSTNLISGSLHYIYEFLKNNNDDIYNGFNWEIRNNLPFDAIILIMTNLISDLEQNHENKSYELRNDIRYHLLDKSIDLIFIKFDNKKRSIIKNCFTLIRYLFQILRLKYLRNDNNGADLIDFNSKYCEQIIPKPLNNRSMLFKRDLSMSNGNGLGNGNGQGMMSMQTTTNCAQIAPRTMRALAGNPSSISFSEHPLNSISVSDMFVNGLTADVFQAPYSNGGSGVGLTGGIDDSYKEHEIQRIRSQITKFLKEERLGDDDRFNNKFYILVENEVKELVERLVG